LKLLTLVNFLEICFYISRKQLLELTPKKDVLFFIGDWNAKVKSQEILGVTGKFGFSVQNEAGQRLTKIFQENTLVIANILFQQFAIMFPSALLYLFSLQYSDGLFTHPVSLS
jgi:hypothetical protein